MQFLTKNLELATQQNTRYSSWQRGLLFMFVCVLLFAVGATTPSAFAQSDDSRIALVIGNDNYTKDPLKNAVNDARRMAEVLSALNFRVVVRLNATLDDMNGGLVEFHRLLPDSRAAVFFYAGHAVQSRGKNYLVPIGANITSEIEIRTKAFEAASVLEYMEDARVSNKIMILDACRNNPFGNEFKLAESGLASMRTSSGTAVAFAAKPGAVAFDAGATEENGLYTKHLLREIVKPNIQAALMFENVSRAVQQESGGKQVPEVLSSPSAGRRAFFFVEGGAPPVFAQVAAGTTGAVRSQLPATGPSGFDLQAAQEMWSLVKNSNRVEDYQRFLSDFPLSPLAAAARFQLESLQRAQSFSQPAPTAALPLNSAQTAAPAILVAEPVLAPTQNPTPTITPNQVSTAPAPVKVTVTPTVTATVAAPPATVRPTTVTVAPSATELKVPAPAPLPLPLPLSPPPSPPVTTAAPVGSQAPATVQAAAPALAPQIQPPQSSLGAALVVSLAPKLPAVQTGRIDFTKDEFYEGQFKELADKSRVLHGPGEFVAKAFRYKGDFVDNKKQGRGEYIWENGDKYDGDWVADTQSGKGKWTWASGDKYEGQVKDGVIVGEGEYFFAKSGDSFKGGFLAGKPHGKGVYNFASGDKYEGEMRAGVQSGQGIYRYKSGDKIENTFVNNAATGHGTYYFSTGNRYVGDMLGGALTGKGILHYANGLRYEGDFVDATPRGKGEFYLNDGSVFIGIFEDGTRKATGVLHAKDGTKSDAEMVNSEVRKIK